MNTPVSDIASPGTLSFLHHDDTSLEDLYDASDGLIHLAQHAGVAQGHRQPLGRYIFLETGERQGCAGHAIV